jgi:hypothetical protein
MPDVKIVESAGDARAAESAPTASAAADLSDNGDATLVQRWDEIKPRVRAKWPKVTAADLRRAPGSVEQLIILIAKKASARRPTIEKALGEMLAAVEPAYEASAARAVVEGEQPSRLEELRRQFQGPAVRKTRPRRAKGAEDQSAADQATGPDEIEVVRVAPRRAPADPVDDPGPRTIIVSKNQGIIGAQG